MTLEEENAALKKVIADKEVYIGGELHKFPLVFKSDADHAEKILSNENATLRKIIVDTIWMARRYADGRKTFAPQMVNDALDTCKGLGVEIDPDWCLLSGENYATNG